VNFDLPVFRAINSFARSTSWLNGPMVAYATYGVVVIAVLLVGGWWLARREARPSMMAAALWAPLATLIAVGINQPIVAAVHEARPYTTLSGVLVLANRTTDPSFPSDHGVMAGAAGVALGVLVAALGYLLVRQPLTALVQALERTRLRPLLTSAPGSAAAVQGD
jgi:membrane-associated phospholipid phosphatase